VFPGSATFPPPPRRPHPTVTDLALQHGFRAPTVRTAVHRASVVHHRSDPVPADRGRRDGGRVHPLLRARAERQLGLFTTGDAVHAGYGPTEIRSLCRSGRWVRLRRGILITAEDLTAGEQTIQRYRIDCLAVLMSLDRPSAVLSHATAARLWQLPAPRGSSLPVRLTDPTQWRKGNGYLMSCAPLSPAERWRSGPLRLTSAPRTLVDCAREWPLEQAVIAIDAALLAERTSPTELAAATTSVRRWPGAARAVRAVALADGRAESPLETRGRLRIVGAGLPRPELQVEIKAGGRLVGVVDAWFDQAAVALEFDGQIKYTDPWRGRTPERVLWDEKRREDALRALDIHVVRIADPDVGTGWPPLERRLRRLLASPGPTRREFTTSARERGRLQTA
jgi:hypothetical protein